MAGHSFVVAAELFLKQALKQALDDLSLQLEGETTTIENFINAFFSENAESSADDLQKLLGVVTDFNNKDCTYPSARFDEESQKIVYLDEKGNPVDDVSKAHRIQEENIGFKTGAFFEKVEETSLGKAFKFFYLNKGLKRKGVTSKSYKFIFEDGTSLQRNENDCNPDAEIPASRKMLFDLLVRDAPRQGFEMPSSINDIWPCIDYYQGHIGYLVGDLFTMKAPGDTLPSHTASLFFGDGSIYKKVFKTCKDPRKDPRKDVASHYDENTNLTLEVTGISFVLNFETYKKDLELIKELAASQELDTSFININEIFFDERCNMTFGDGKIRKKITYGSNGTEIVVSNVPNDLKPLIKSVVENAYSEDFKKAFTELHSALENTYILTLKRDIDDFRKIKTACDILARILSDSSNSIISKINDGNFDEVDKIAQMKGFSKINEKNMSMPTNRHSTNRKKKRNKSVNRNRVVSWCKSVKVSANSKLKALEKTLRDFEQQQQQQQQQEEFMKQAREAIGEIRRLGEQYGEDQSKKKNDIDRYCDSVSKTLESSKSTLHKPGAQVKFVNDMIVKSESHFKHNHENLRVIADIFVGLLCLCLGLGFLVKGLRSYKSKARARSSCRPLENAGSRTFRNASTKRRRAVEKILFSKMSQQSAAAPSA